MAANCIAGMRFNFKIKGKGTSSGMRWWWQSPRPFADADAFAAWLTDNITHGTVLIAATDEQGISLPITGMVRPSRAASWSALFDGSAGQ